MIDIATIRTEPIVFTSKERLIYDLLFDESATIYHIRFDDYCICADRPHFRDEIRTVLKKGKVRVMDDRIIHEDKDVYWKLTIKHL